MAREDDCLIGWKFLSGRGRCATAEVSFFAAGVRERTEVDAFAEQLAEAEGKYEDASLAGKDKQHGR